MRFAFLGIVGRGLGVQKVRDLSDLPCIFLVRLPLPKTQGQSASRPCVLEQTLEQFPHAREWLSFLEESLFEI